MHTIISRNLSTFKVFPISIAFFISACTPGTESEEISYEVSTVEDKTYAAQESVNITVTVSPEATLDSCSASDLPAGLTASLSGDSTYCEITGAPLEVMEATKVVFTVNVGSNTLESEFMLTVNNLVPDIPVPPDQTLVLNETISEQEYLSTAGVDIQACYLGDIPDGLSVRVNTEATGCIISGTPRELLSSNERYFAAVNSEGYDVEYFTYEVVRPNEAPDLRDADDINAIQDNAISDVTFDNPTGGEGLTSCTSSPTLPSGLSVSVSSDTTSCTISGAPTVLLSESVFTITGTNTYGSDTADVTISVSRDSAKLSLDEDLIKAFGFSWNTVVQADHYTLYEKKNDAASFTELMSFTQNTGEYTKHLTSLFEWPNTEYYLETCFDAGKSECISDNTVSTSQYLSETIGYIKASTVDTQDQFGAAIALSGDGTTMAVCAPGEESASTGINGDESDNSADNAGAVYIFVDDGNNNWSQQAYIKADLASAEDRFCGLQFYRPRAALRGLALSDDGNTLAVAASGAEAVYVFNRSSTTWTQTQKLTAEYSDDGDLFGQSIDMNADGDRIIIGAPYEDCNNTGINTCDGSNNSDYNYGAAYLFSINSTSGNWEQELYIKSPAGNANDWFGYSVAMADDGETFAVSEFFGNVLPVTSDVYDAGAVYIYNYDDMTETWSEDDDYLYATNRSSYSRFGTAMDFSADGNRLAIGAFSEESKYIGVEGLTYQDIEDNNGAGAAYVFDRAAKGSDWSQSVYIKPERLSVAKAFGISIELSDNGEQLFVGASGDLSIGRGLNGDINDLDNMDTSFTHGSVYHYILDGGTWTFTNYLKGSNHTDGHDIAFGYDIAISNDTSVIAIGAPGDSSQYTGISAYRYNTSNNFAGAVHLY